MELTTLFTVIATLRVIPNRCQFFQYESVCLSCEQQGISSEWTIRRNTSTKINEVCLDSRNTSACQITDLYPSDSGAYWCQSGAGKYSNSVIITVTAGSVILESPAHPVLEGEAVTLHCLSTTTSPLSLTAAFYKDGVLVETSSTGNMTIRSVSKSDEGLYKCSISGAGESPDSWVSVTEATYPEPSQSTLALILLPVLVKCLALVLLILMILRCHWRNHKEEKQRRRRRRVSSVAAHRSVRYIYSPEPVLTCKTSS
ncbi:low affinity immunoglobulin gamma Fc region receptor II-b-like [Anabas testudineus]|uniref:low affinity immunoglobulin gamma Fc region receptor II-b-like n=1 Tax=Anabas testudineus TaxID=64144 RepID=UPI000E456103|nr:low affinity immunoglobulin gamma Fc region receptor II-b-like [Anabas testudineus]